MRAVRGSEFEGLRIAIETNLKRYLDAKIAKIEPLFKEINGNTCFDVIIAASTVTEVPISKFFEDKRETDNVRIRELAWWYMRYVSGLNPASICLLTGHTRSTVSVVAKKYNELRCVVFDVAVLHDTSQMKAILTKKQSK